MSVIKTHRELLTILPIRGRWRLIFLAGRETNRQYIKCSPEEGQPLLHCLAFCPLKRELYHVLSTKVASKRAPLLCFSYIGAVAPPLKKTNPPIHQKPSNFFYPVACLIIPETLCRFP